MAKMKDKTGENASESKYAKKGGKVMYSAAYNSWRANPNSFTAGNHRKYVEQQHGLLAKSRPVNYNEQETNHEFAEAAE